MPELRDYLPLPNLGSQILANELNSVLHRDKSRPCGTHIGEVSKLPRL
jgi:hypothetical protein